MRVFTSGTAGPCFSFVYSLFIRTLRHCTSERAQGQILAFKIAFGLEYFLLSECPPTITAGPCSVKVEWVHDFWGSGVKTIWPRMNANKRESRPAPKIKPKPKSKSNQAESKGREKSTFSPFFFLVFDPALFLILV